MRAVVLVDMQNDFIWGSLANEEAQKKIPLICETIEQLADSETVFIATMDTHDESYAKTQEGMKLPITHCVKNTWGHLIEGDVLDAICSNSERTIYLQKPTFGSFDLLNTLWELDTECGGLEDITVFGFCTDICVVTNVALIKTAFPEVPVSVVEDCCAGVTPEAHAAAITTMKSYQVNII